MTLLKPWLMRFAVPAILAALASPSYGQEAPRTPPRIISMTGDGEVRAAPDEAQLSAGVVSQAQTAAEALKANTEAMNAVFAALKRMGIPDKSIQTSNFSVSPRHPPYRPDATDTSKIIGYEVSNQVTVTLDDISKVGSALDALVSAGANQIGGVNFTIRDPEPLLAKARTEAVKDATARAETYARAAGVSLGPVLAIREGGAEAPRPMFMRAETMAMKAAPAPVAAGEQTVSANVTIDWQIR